MKKRVAVAVAIAATCVAAFSSGALAAPKPFSVVAVRISSTATTTTSSFTENLFVGKKVVGQDAVKCQAAGSNTTCEGTFTFKTGGTITINGILATPSKSLATFKISGGTGPYARAAGTLELAPVSATKTKITFALT